MGSVASPGRENGGRMATKPDSTPLTREEAWQMYLAKLEEEGNYFTVTKEEEEEEQVCSCPECCVSKVLNFMYISHESKILGIVPSSLLSGFRGIKT